MALPETYEPAVERVRRAMASADIRSGWVPEGAEDLVLVEIFACFWPAGANPPVNATTTE
jgi:hypothetical protein